MNLYGYVGNGPIGAIDPLGLDPGVIMIAPDQSLSPGLSYLISNGKAKSPYAEIEDAAKSKGMKIYYYAEPQDVKAASQAKNPDGTVKNDEVIFYSHGGTNGMLGLYGEIKLSDIFSPNDGGKRTVLSCHSDKVVSPAKIKEYKEGGTNLGGIPGKTNTDGTIYRDLARDALKNYLIKK